MKVCRVCTTNLLITATKLKRRTMTSLNLRDSSTQQLTITGEIVTLVLVLRRSKSASQEMFEFL